MKMHGNRSLFWKLSTGSVLYSLWPDGGDEKRGGDCASQGLNERGCSRSQTAGESIHPRLAKRVCSSGSVSPVIPCAALFLFMSPHCYAASQSPAILQVLHVPESLCELQYQQGCICITVEGNTLECLYPLTT